MTLQYSLHKGFHRFGANNIRKFSKSSHLNGLGDVRVSFEEAKVTHTSLFSSVWQTMVYEVVFMTGTKNLKGRKKQN